VDKPLAWNGGLVAINSFGFGGANAHIVLRSNPKPKVPAIQDNIPRLVALSGRTEEAVNYFLDKVRIIYIDCSFNSGTVPAIVLFVITFFDQWHFVSS
jgi:fatty acid synthase